jgi:7,8-dihydro-6-hydroxymethylpterin-pyrophosphokinase
VPVPLTVELLITYQFASLEDRPVGSRSISVDCVLRESHCTSPDAVIAPLPTLTSSEFVIQTLLVWPKICVRGVSRWKAREGRTTRVVHGTGDVRVSVDLTVRALEQPLQ